MAKRASDPPLPVVVELKVAASLLQEMVVSITEKMKSIEREFFMVISLASAIGFVNSFQLPVYHDAFGWVGANKITVSRRVILQNDGKGVFYPV